MACAGSLLSEEQFLCSICLDVFTDPITTPCGHNYCKTCITHYWDTSDLCQCPLCKETLNKRPALSVNKVLSEMADQFRKSKQLKTTSATSQETAKSDEVSCDICSENKNQALESCLVYLSYYCETHLCVCNYKLHQIVSMKEAYKGKKAELRKTEAEVQQMIQEKQLKIQEVKHSVEVSKKDADRDIADSVQVFTALISCIERSQAEVIDVIEEKQKTTEKQAEGLLKELQQEITELKKRSSELKQLSLTEDHLHLLQNFTSISTPPPAKGWTEVSVNHSPYLGTVRTAVAQLKKTLSQVMRDAELRRIQQYALDVTLDPDTAHCRLILSPDGKQVSHGDVKKNVPDNKDRFSPRVSVLGKHTFSSGRFYYEVQVKGKTDWSLGVARESINRKGQIPLAPNDGYWSIVLRNGNEYCAAADPAVLLPVRKKLQKVGVFVDYEEGLVSFYDVETRVHLYSFTGCTFTEKLYPYFSPSTNNGGINSAPLIISPVSHTD